VVLAVLVGVTPASFHGGKGCSEHTDLAAPPRWVWSCAGGTQREDELPASGSVTCRRHGCMRRRSSSSALIARMAGSRWKSRERGSSRFLRLQENEVVVVTFRGVPCIRRDLRTRRLESTGVASSAECSLSCSFHELVLAPIP
jgi:hypothetical protein